MLSCGVGSAGEISSGVVNFTFLRAQHSFRYVEIHILEGTGLLSSPHRGEQSRSERNAPSLLAVLAGGGATAMQCHEIFRGAKLPRSNQKRGQQASEHDINQRQTDEQSSHEDDGIFRGWMVPNGCRLNFLAACLYWFHHE